MKLLNNYQFDKCKGRTFATKPAKKNFDAYGYEGRHTAIITKLKIKT